MGDNEETARQARNAAMLARMRSGEPAKKPAKRARAKLNLLTTEQSAAYHAQFAVEPCSCLNDANRCVNCR